MASIATIGYETASVPAFLETLKEEGIDLLVDVRAVASSRRPGFAKSKLAANLGGAGIDYLHFRQLGTPAEGRHAARAGRVKEMHRIYAEHLATEAAQDELKTLAELVRSGRHICLLCLEANADDCHRSLIVDALKEKMKLTVTNLCVAPAS